LEAGKAKVVRRTPFTIQLLGPSGGNVQPISLGVDAGTKHIGLSATTTKQVLFEAEVQLRTDIQNLMSSRKAFRNSRRSRKTRYRQPRFQNRTKPKGWLAPSVQNKVSVHVKVIELVHQLLPITNVVIEAAQFDIQKIKNPGIQGTAYQQGPQLGFENVRAYVLYRDGHVCQHCRGKSKDKILKVHHIESRKTGGDSPDNLITLCKTCHDTVHRDKLTRTFKRSRPSFRDAGQITTMRRFVLQAVKNLYPNVTETYGYVTKYTRKLCGLEKSHIVDARCTSGNALAAPNEICAMRQVRGQNRQLHKATITRGGIRKVNKAARYVHGFQLFDKVVLKGQECFVFGRRSSGQFDVRLLDGTTVTPSVSYKKLRLVEKASTLLIQKRSSASSPELKLGVSALEIR
jgi:hypothetical protein